ncbi:ROK family protein [Microbacterium marinilacus]|uniref:ROK family protein n=1 Tax=Microbacterium marinilacus TaxID=415209 RepID=A0ABP7BEB4_9MICO|nr:ROK family protein [Microbacterium marinilacus]MBY0689322.1 ROK family protein [Microbacterium marinilacus]
MTAAPPAVRVGVDVGGTKVEAVAIDAAGGILARMRRETVRGEAGVIASVSDAVARVAAEPGVGPVAAVGIGIPGQIVGARVRNAVNLGISDLDLGGEVTAAVGAAVHVENDVNAAAAGAYAIRGAVGASMAYLNLGTGIAAGIVHDGRVWPGAGGTAGEVGHVSIDPRGPECPCGQRGCIETLAGGGAVARRWSGDGEHPVLDLFDAADAADGRALSLRGDLARGVAAAVRVLVLTADPAVVVIGGGVSRLGDRLLDVVRGELRASSERSAFLTSLRLHERIELLPSDAPAGALGAALLAPAFEGVARG